MSDIALAIDFGTSRTKVAWRDAKGKIEVLRFGELDYLPSLFYVAPEDQALEMGLKADKCRTDDPGGFIEQLKRKITNKTIRTANGAVKPEEILEHFFRYIREQTIDKVEAFKQNGLPDEVTLTLPANAEWELAGKLKMSAMKAGFARTIEEYEPVAAARAWFIHEKTENKPLIVLDCGGGTTDWVCVEPWEGRMRLSSKYQPTAINMGGVDVDEALLQWLITEIPLSFENISEERLSSLKGELTQWKEQVLSNTSTEPIRLKGKLLPLTETITKKIFQEHYTIPLFDGIKSFVEIVKKDYSELDILVVGGTANTLINVQLEELKVPVHTWDNNSEAATVVGALSINDKTRLVQPSKDDLIAHDISSTVSNCSSLIQILLADENIDSLHRLSIGDKLAQSGDPRSGVGLNNRKLPDIDWVEIPEGEFIYGEGDKKQTIGLDRYYISRYPITNIQYQVFINSGGYEKKWQRDLSKIDSSDPSWTVENRPRETVNWYEAVAFTRWLSYELGYEIRLPTEQEWEKAARGTNGRRFPWGNSYFEGYANLNEEATYSGYPSYQLNQTRAVGLYPLGASPYGVLDMIGNVLEWCLNNYMDPKVTKIDTRGRVRVLRGGSWYLDETSAKCTKRFWRKPEVRSNRCGFRVVCSHID